MFKNVHQGKNWVFLRLERSFHLPSINLGQNQQAIQLTAISTAYCLNCQIHRKINDILAGGFIFSIDVNNLKKIIRMQLCFMNFTSFSKFHSVEVPYLMGDGSLAH